MYFATTGAASSSTNMYGHCIGQGSLIQLAIPYQEDYWFKFNNQSTDAKVQGAKL